MTSAAAYQHGSDSQRILSLSKGRQNSFLRQSYIRKAHYQ